MKDIVMREYSSEIKEAMVAKLCSPGGPTLERLSEETGISRASLYNWRRAGRGGKSLSKKNRRAKDWSPQERLEAVFEASSLNESDLGEFLRKRGLHSTDIESWKQEALDDASQKKSRGRPKKDPELAATQLELKRVKKDLNRKDKALAEQAALLILQKKLN